MSEERRGRGEEVPHFLIFLGARAERGGRVEDEGWRTGVREYGVDIENANGGEESSKREKRKGLFWADRRIERKRRFISPPLPMRSIPARLTSTRMHSPAAATKRADCDFVGLSRPASNGSPDLLIEFSSHATT